MRGHQSPLYLAQPSGDTRTQQIADAGHCADENVSAIGDSTIDAYISTRKQKHDDAHNVHEAEQYFWSRRSLLGGRRVLVRVLNSVRTGFDVQAADSACCSVLSRRQAHPSYGRRR